MSNKIKSKNPTYDELQSMPENLVINVGDVVWRQPSRGTLFTGWEGAWVLVLHKEDFWTAAPERSEEFVDRPWMNCYDVLSPDGRVQRYTDAVLRKEKPDAKI